MSAGNRILRFEGFELHLNAGELRRNGSVVRLQEKPFQLLSLLLETPGELVTREAIRQRLWGTETYVEFDDSLNHAVRKLREALKDSAENPRFIETKPRRGYRFVAPLEGIGQSRRPMHVGREQELAELHRWLDEARSSGGSMLCISGEPGIGKTTLAGAFLAEVTKDLLCYVGRGRCSERLVGTDAYLPIFESLENMLRGAVGIAVGAILKQTAPSWCAELPPELLPVEWPDAAALAEARAASQERRKREFAAFLNALTRERAVILFLDDLHWADVSTVDLLSYVVPRSRAIPVCFLGTYRPSDLALSHHPFLDLKLELQAQRLSRELELAPLGLQDVRSFIDLQFPGNAFPPDFASWIFERTEGHSLFLADLLRALAEAGVVAERDGRWESVRSLAEAGASLPVSVRGMVERKIGRLSGEHRRLLEAASVEGHEFHSAVLGRVLGIDTAELEDSLEELSGKHYLVRFCGEREFPDKTFTLCYAFSHALYQSALYAKQSPTRRAALSAATADTLAACYRGAEDEIASRLGYLYEAARKWDRAAEFMLAGARNAAKQSAHRESATLALRAIEAAGRMDGPERDRRRLEATLQLAQTRQSLSNWQESIADFESAASIAIACGDVQAQVAALCGSALSAGYLKRMDEMCERATRALKVARDAGVETAYPESLLGYHAIYAGDLTRSREYYERAVPALTRCGPPAASIMAATSLGFLHHLQSEYREAEGALAEAMQQMQSAGEWTDLIRATWYRGIVLANQGRIAEALDTLGKGMRLADLNGERYWYSRFPNTIGWVHGELGDVESAIRFNEEGVRAAQEADIPEPEANAHMNLANGYVAIEQFDRAWSHLAEGKRILNAEDYKNWLRWRFHIRLSVEETNYWIAAGDLARARTSACDALDRATKSLARKHEAAAHKYLGDIAALEHRDEEARREYHAALAILQAHPCPFVEWKVLLAAGNLAARCGDGRPAELWLSAAAAKVAFIVNQTGSGSLGDGFLRWSAARPLS